MGIFRKLFGKAKEETGRKTNNPKMEFEGKTERLKEEAK